MRLKQCILIVAVILLILSACFLIQDRVYPKQYKNSKMSDDGSIRQVYCDYMTDLLNNNKEDLEKTAAEMEKQGIDFFSMGSPFRIVGNGNKRVKKVIYTESLLRTVRLLSRSPYLGHQFGWSGDHVPLFTKGERYFYVSSKRIDEYGYQIELWLIYSHNSINDLQPYTKYEDLGDGWLLITEYYGE